MSSLTSSSVLRSKINKGEITILHVDDDEGMLQLTKAQLERSHERFQVYSLTSGIHAIESLQHQTFDLIITDLNMPMIDGFELIEAVREQDPAIPIVVYSSRPRSDFCLAESVGADGFVQKGLDFFDKLQELVNLIKCLVK